MDTIKVELYIGTGFAAVNHTEIVDIDKEFWDEMEQHEKDKYLDDMAVEYLFEKCECSARVIS